MHLNPKAPLSSHHHPVVATGPTGALDPAVLAIRVQSLASLLTPAANADQERWDRALSFEEAIAALTEAINTRHAVMSEIVDGGL